MLCDSLPYPEESWQQLTVLLFDLQEPCMSFVLQDVICPSCNDCRDLDLCRDPQLQVSFLLQALACAHVTAFCMFRPV